MLGANNAREEQLEAENRVLRSELMAANQRGEMLRAINTTLRWENDALVMEVGALAAATQHATQQAQAGRGYVPGDNVMMRLCWN